MSIQWDVTDTVAPAGVISACAVGRILATAQANTADLSGGGSTTSFLLFAKLQNVLTAMYEITPANDLEWHAGTYTVGINATGSDFTWKSTWICWLDNVNNVLCSIASSIDHNTSLFNPGIKTVDLTGIQVPNKANGDKLYAVMRIRNNAAIGATLSYTNDGHLIAPFDTGGVTTVNIKGNTIIKGAKIL